MPLAIQPASANRALDLLFPLTGRRAIDVKFSMDEATTVERLSEQICVCFQTSHDPSYLILDVDAD